MTSQIRRWLTLAALVIIGSVGAATAMAQHGGGGGTHGGGGFHGAGGFHSAAGVRGAGGFHTGGSRGGNYYRGWRGGYYGGGLGWLGYGLAFSALPLYYDTFWWGGVPYYYADDNYYLWDSAADAYETVQPPEGLVKQIAAAPSNPQNDPQAELFAYPRTGQSAAQQTRDRDECRQWATGQTGSDAAKHADYLRAEEACLTGRGYSVR